MNALRREKDAAVEARERAHGDRYGALSRLVSGVAHEIANPLNATAGGLRALRRELDRGGPPEAGERARRALELAEAGRARIGSIVENLRAYTASEAAPRVEVDVDAEIRRALELETERLEAAGVRLTTTLASRARASLVAGELGQIVTNLVANARQALTDGGELTIRSSADAGRITIEVADDGPGVAPEVRDRIFEPFVTTRPPGEGRGLGLSIAHEIAVRHGGELALVASPPSARGATFRLTLPACPPPPAD
jgi:signal transduction histidine kinase